MLVDLFPFNDELDLLELRLRELEGLVDRHVLVEAPVTFRNTPKPLYFRENRERFAAWPIESIDPGTPPEGPHPAVDWWQRASLTAALAALDDDDWILLGDVDEIPRPSSVKQAVMEKSARCLSMRLFYYSPRRLDPAPWLGTVVCQVGMVGCLSMQELRDMRGNFPQIRDAGWHFSWQGGAAGVKRKLKCVDIERENAIYGSDGIVAPEDQEIERRVDEGLDLFGRGHRPKLLVDLDPGGMHPRNVGLIA